MAVLEKRPIDTLRERIEEIRATGLLPTVRNRVEEVVSTVRGRVKGGGLTKAPAERIGEGAGAGGKVAKKIRGL